MWPNDCGLRKSDTAGRIRNCWRPKTNARNRSAEAEEYAERNIQKFFASIFGSRLIELGKADFEAYKLLNEVKIESAHNSCPFPVGGQITKKVSKGWGYNKTIQVLKGVVEVVTPETQMPRNLSSYSRPRIGALIVRLVNSDGKPGKKIIHLTQYEATLWKLAK